MSTTWLNDNNVEAHQHHAIDPIERAEYLKSYKRYFQLYLNCVVAARYNVKFYYGEPEYYLTKLRFVQKHLTQRGVQVGFEKLPDLGIALRAAENEANSSPDPPQIAGKVDTVSLHQLPQSSSVDDSVSPSPAALTTVQSIAHRFESRASCAFSSKQSKPTKPQRKPQKKLKINQAMFNSKPASPSAATANTIRPTKKAPGKLKINAAMFNTKALKPGAANPLQQKREQQAKEVEEERKKLEQEQEKEAQLLAEKEKAMQQEQQLLLQERRQIEREKQELWTLREKQRKQEEQEMRRFKAKKEAQLLAEKEKAIQQQQQLLLLEQHQIEREKQELRMWREKQRKQEEQLAKEKALIEEKHRMEEGHAERQRAEQAQAECDDSSDHDNDDDSSDHDDEDDYGFNMGYDTNGRKLYRGTKNRLYYILGGKEKYLPDKTTWDKDAKGRQLEHGPQGGIFYINRKGKKSYKKKWK